MLSQLDQNLHKWGTWAHLTNIFSIAIIQIQWKFNYALIQI